MITNDTNLIKNPLELSRDISRLSDDYYKAALEMGTISERSGFGWMELRRECKTDSETHKKWAATADGKREAYLRWYLKAVEKKVSAMKMELRILTGLGG